jgi:hypothetical protein
MEQYPSITKTIQDLPIFAFDKLDGSNIRVEYSRKTGFQKFGTRHRLLDENDERFGDAIPIFRETLEETLTKLFLKHRFEKATAFLEYVGENSFAGYHENETHKLVLFDIHVYKRGILPPKEFLRAVGDLVETPAVLYVGKANSHLVEAVKTSTLDGMTFEGVVCKGERKTRPVMFKLKSQAWLDRLKGKCGEDERLYKELM